MTTPEQQLRSFATARVPAPASMTELERRVSSRRRRRWSAGGIAGALFLIIGVAAVAVDGGDERTPVDVVDEPATPTSVASSTTTSTTTTSTTAARTYPADLADAVVTPSAEGVELIARTGAERISTRPASTAFAIGTEFVVFQDAIPGVAVFPPHAEGPVHLWQRRSSGVERRDLPTATGVSRLRLLDAAEVAGTPVALIEESSGNGPEDHIEELVLVDLRDDTRTTVVRREVWESSHHAARVLPDGDVVGLVWSAAGLELVRWSPGDPDPVWTVQLGDTYGDLALRDGDVHVVDMAFQGAEFTPVLTLTPYDIGDGTADQSRMVEITDPGGEIETGLFCTDWIGPAQLLCGRGGGEPVAVDVDSGSYTSLPWGTGTMASAARPRTVAE